MSDRHKTGFFSRSIGLLLILTLVFLTSCSPPRRVSAEERMFRKLSLELVDRYEIPKATYQNTPVGGLSAIAYNRQQDLFYVLSDDRGKRSPARFYTFKLRLQSDNASIKIASFEPQAVTFLLDEEGKQYPAGSIDPEGLAISPRNTIFISSEGDPRQNVPPFIAEYDLTTGQKKSQLRLPQRYLASGKSAESTHQGVRENLGFESLTIERTGPPEDPFRIFTATESALTQDTSSEEESKIRFLHYSIDSVGEPILVAEHMYLLDPAPVEVISNGLTELLALPKEGYFLSLERTFGFEGAGAKIFQAIVGNAIDTSNIVSLKGNTERVRPIRKKLLLDLAELGIYLDNLEGMSLGPRLPDGSRSLLLISDDNFSDEQISQLLLFRLSEN